MKEFTMIELYDMRDAAYETYESALNEQMFAAYEAYESALNEQMFDDEEHDKIAELKADVEQIYKEIARRKGEQG